MGLRRTGSKLTPRARTDVRRPLLVYLDQEIIKQLKKAALDQEKTAYEITEYAVREWLAANKVRRKPKAG